MEEKRNLSPSERIKPFAFSLVFFEKSAEKIIRACSSLSTFKKKQAENEEKSSQSNSLEVLSENLGPNLFESEKQLKGIPTNFGNPVLKNIKEIYSFGGNYSGKRASYKSSFTSGSSQKNSEYGSVVNYQEGLGEDIVPLFIKEVLTFKF